MRATRPKNCRYPNCSQCLYTDCEYDGLERKDEYEQEKFDKELEVVEPEIRARRERQRRYNNSDKGKVSRKRYSLTEKGIDNEKRKRKKKIDNGKNAEYCRRYYYKKKLQMQS